MQTSYNRRTATKVVDGETRRKNRHAPTTHRGYVINREAAGRGCRHVLTKRDVQAFVELIPDWPALSHRLERIVLAGGGVDDGAHEFYRREETGAIFLHAWEKELWAKLPRWYFDAHRDLFHRFGVSCELQHDHAVCRFTEEQARAFMLLHVFMHELGHHWDRIHQKHHDATRGEGYAERFAVRHFEQIFPAYVRAFGDPAKSA